MNEKMNGLGACLSFSITLYQVSRDVPDRPSRQLVVLHFQSLSFKCLRATLIFALYLQVCSRHFQSAAYTKEKSSY